MLKLIAGTLTYGDIYSTFGFNEAEGIRLRGGGRTYFGQNDPWRLEGFLAYGFKDKKFKHGISGKWLLDPKNRIIISGGHRRDIEQLGINLTSTTDVLGRSIASSAIFTVGNNNRLTNINLTTFNLEFEPWNQFQGSLRNCFSDPEFCPSRGFQPGLARSRITDRRFHRKSSSSTSIRP